MYRSLFQYSPRAVPGMSSKYADPIRTVLTPLIVLATMLLGATIGYVLLERFTLFEALYMVVITLSTVGYGEVHELSPAGRVLTIGLILGGVGTAGVAVGRLLDFMVERRVGGAARRKRMQKTLKELREHFILCGFGRVGHQIAEEFREHGVPFAVIENNPAYAEELALSDIPYVTGGAADDDVLEEAGIKRARGLVAAVDSDAENVFVTLTARVLNPSLFIVARASEPETETKLKKAGANRVVSPYVIGGRRMAAMSLKPATIDFLDTMIRPGDMMLCIEELRVGKDSPVAGKTLMDSQIRQKAGAMVLAVRYKDGTFEFNPSASYKIQVGDWLIVLGTKDQCSILEQHI
ncbi:MAG: NAD-binding protein [Candidatus Eiseniibacteriota bacterium]|nr:MAG: NAD-binding protein [Candidatus Eisenbacteria bacterium]